jgi:hypothetical protein
MKHALLLFALIATQAQAQIIYTDVTPDATYNNINGDTLQLDLDGGGVIDFKLSYGRTMGPPCQLGGCAGDPSSPTHVRAYPIDVDNAVMDSTAGYSLNLQTGDGIDAAMSWDGSAGQILAARVGTVCFPGGGFTYACRTGVRNGTWSMGNNVGYLGLRFHIGSMVHYGWVRLVVPQSTFSILGFTVMDYAYNSVPGEGILAGDMGSISTGITSSALRGMQVAPNPFTSTLSISLPTGTTGSVSCRVLSLLGQAVITRTVAATSGPSSFTLDLASLAPGTYLLEMQTGGERMVRKVVKE